MTHTKYTHFSLDASDYLSYFKIKKQNNSPPKTARIGIVTAIYVRIFIFLL